MSASPKRPDSPSLLPFTGSTRTLLDPKATPKMFTFPMPGQLSSLRGSGSPAMTSQKTFRTASQLFSLRPSDAEETKLAILMVGLPARGKSYISHKMRRWLSWCGYPTKVFNVGNARRQVSAVAAQTTKDTPTPGAATPTPAPAAEVPPQSHITEGLEASTLGTTQGSDFFDPNDKNKSLIRDQLAMNVLEDMIEWLNSGLGCVGIHDATNTTLKRRQMLLKRLEREKDIQVIFVESVCSDPEVLSRNISLKTLSPDYKDMDKEQAKKDFEQRLKNYEKAYEPIPDEDMGYSFIKIIDVGRRVIANRIQGFLPSQIVFYLMNIHIEPRKIHLVRAGLTNDSHGGRLGRDLPLNSEGAAFAKRLGEYIREQHPVIISAAQSNKAISEDSDTLQVWSSALLRAVQTAKCVTPNYRVFRTLNELNAGACEGMTKDEIRERMPLEYEARETDKLAYRYPGGGESYLDVVERVRPLIVELERVHNSVLVVSHSAVLRTLYAYFMDVPLEEVPYINIPVNTLITLSIGPYVAECSITTLKD